MYPLDWEDEDNSTVIFSVPAADDKHVDFWPGVYKRAPVPRENGPPVDPGAAPRRRKRRTAGMKLLSPAQALGGAQPPPPRVIHHEEGGDEDDDDEEDSSSDDDGEDGPQPGGGRERASKLKRAYVQPTIQVAVFELLGHLCSLVTQAQLFE
jgi:hypothetical protein